MTTPTPPLAEPPLGGQRPRRAYRAHRLLSPDLTWREDAYLVVDEAGLIAEITDAPPPDVEIVHLGPCAVVPGQINAHSHAFQRAIRGVTEAHMGSEGDDFWGWRTQMYDVALRCTPEDMAVIARMAFVEMALAGITAVGEFHYLHHQPDGQPYADANAMAHAVIEAARSVGLRITLLRVGYHRGGHDRDLDPRQRRFVEPDADTWLGRAEALRGHWAHDEAVQVGLAPHSVRAVPARWLQAAAEHAARVPQPIHIHACEQQAELAQCAAEHGGRGPIQVIEEAGMLARWATIVHGVHLADGDPTRLAQAGATVCACPSTERNLGDGVVPAAALMAAGVPLCVGSDSHTQIDPWSELRQVEYHERLWRQQRNVLGRLHPTGSTAAALMPMGTVAGAEAIGQPGGALQLGAPADFVALDLEHPSLAGALAGDLLSDIVLSMSPGAVRDVVVAGRPIVEGGVHPKARRICADFAAWRARHRRG